MSNRCSRARKLVRLTLLTLAIFILVRVEHTSIWERDRYVQTPLPGKLILEAAREVLYAEGADSQHRSQALYRLFLTFYPNSPLATEARLGTLRTFLRAGDIPGATATLQIMERTSQCVSDFSSEWFTIAQAHLEATNSLKALSLLSDIQTRFPSGQGTALACVSAAEIYRKLGDESKMLEAYKRAIRLKPIDTYGDIMDANNSRSRAYERLGDYYMDRKQWREALRWWSTWEPTSWCGNCAASMECHRAFEIGLCKLNLGQTNAALRVMEPWVTGKKSYSCSQQMAVLFVDVHAALGSLAPIVKQLGAVKKTELNRGTKIALEYIELINLRESRDEEGLWQIITNQWISAKPPLLQDQDQRAREALIYMGDEAEVFLMRKLQNNDIQMQVACSVLGEMNCVKVVPALQIRIESESDYNSLAVLYKALALVGTEDARKLLTQYADKSDGDHRRIAGETLKHWPED